MEMVSEACEFCETNPAVRWANLGVDVLEMFPECATGGWGRAPHGEPRRVARVLNDTLGVAGREVAATVENSGDGTRTHDLRIMRPPFG